MNVTAVTIPQLFYDFIARVIPGFFLSALFLLFFPVLSEDYLPEAFTASDNFISSFFKAAGYLIICYIIGWILEGYRVKSRSKIVKKEHEAKLDPDEIPLRKMYQKIRNTYEKVGFRIIKLRAEARMLEANRMAAYLVAILCFVFFIIAIFQKGFQESDTYIWLGKSLILFVVGYSFQKSEPKAWNRYWGNVKEQYRILFDKEKDSKQKKSDK